MSKFSDFNLKKAFEELDALNAWFEREDIDLDEALDKFKRGMELVRQAKERLKDVENEFETVKKSLEENSGEKEENG
jgi:exodeoxyribonuclease VII small subunit